VNEIAGEMIFVGAIVNSRIPTASNKAAEALWSAA
jgi:hypothetical protein